MSQMPQQAALPTCPSCAEPLESGDRFCGACGYDLSAVPARPEDHPTIALHGSAAGRAAGVEWPAAPQADGSGRPAPVHRPADLPGTDAGGAPLP
ncbi:zinc-ribbon domain-containing protein, partial [Streptomyces sp. PRKS01-65]